MISLKIQQKHPLSSLDLVLFTLLHSQISLSSSSVLDYISISFCKAWDFYFDMRFRGLRVRVRGCVSMWLVFKVNSPTALSTWKSASHYPICTAEN